MPDGSRNPVSKRRPTGRVDTSLAKAEFAANRGGRDRRRFRFARLLRQTAAFRRSLLRWYRRSARPLPWRQSPSPYKTVISEFMLQQTQVKTVLPYFARWMERLPDFAALAAAGEDEVLRLWEGLGYYSRARNLHRLAKEIAVRGVPGTVEGWRELPGVGPYTSAAIASIAFGQTAVCVDGNVVRVLARLTADRTAFPSSTGAAKAFAPLAAALLSPRAAGDHNQAMMEVGATVCLPRNPACHECPLERFCAARAMGRPEESPRFTAKRVEARIITRVWCRRNGKVLLRRIPAEERRFAGLHELPSAESIGFTPPGDGSGVIALKRRTITRFRITETIFSAPPPAGVSDRSLVWVPLKTLERFPMSGPHRRWVREILENTGGVPMGRKPVGSGM